MAEKIFNGRELMARAVSKPNIIGIIFFIMIWAISEVFLIGVIAGLFARWTVRKYDRTVINQIAKTSLRTPNTISYDIPENISHDSAYDQLLNYPDNSTMEKGDVFEAYCAVLLDQMTYTIHSINGGGGDGGIDIFASKSDELTSLQILIQCKNYPNSNIPYDVYANLAGNVRRERNHQGIIMTTGGFTAQCMKFDEIDDDMHLIDGETIRRLSDRYLNTWNLNNILQRAQQWK